MEFSSPQNKNHCPVYFQNETGLCLCKIVHEWNGHLEVFSRPQVLANPRQYLLLRTDILQKTVVGCPC